MSMPLYFSSDTIKGHLEIEVETEMKIKAMKLMVRVPSRWSSPFFRLMRTLGAMAPSGLVWRPVGKPDSAGCTPVHER